MVYSFVYLVILICAVSCSSATSCGKPGRSRRCVPVNTEDRRVFAEGFIVEYYCRGLLIGDESRKCGNGTWSGSIPKCCEYSHHMRLLDVAIPDHLAELLNSTEISAEVVATTKVDFKWKHKMRIVGLVFGLGRPNNQSIWPKIDIDQDAGLSSWHVSVDDRIQRSFQLVRILVWSPNVRYISKRDKFSVKTRNQIAECSENADGSLVLLDNGTDGLYLCLSESWYWLYHLDEKVDDCDTPDTPVNVRGLSTFRSGTTLHASYVCEEGYRLKLSQAHESPKCSENGDWTAYEFQPCEKVFCDREEIDITIVSVDKSAADGSHFPIGTKGFLSCSTLQDQRYVVCAENGAWIPATELCGTRFFKNDGLVIGLVVTLGLLIVLLPIIGVWLLYRAKCNATDIKIRTRTQDSSANNSAVFAESDHEARNYESLNYDYVNYDDTQKPVIT